MQHKINKKLIKSGVNIVDINSTYITKDSFVDKNTTIYPNTYIVNSKIGNNCTVGPFAHIKKNSIIFGDCKIGNFVEIKNSTIGHNTKISHHAYIGDSKIGSFVNIGCGVITCNYDGLNKNQVIVNDRSFIGSNVNLIAPVTIGTDTYIASGSTVYNDADNFDFVIARSYQVNKKGYSTKEIVDAGIGLENNGTFIDRFKGRAIFSLTNMFLLKQLYQQVMQKLLQVPLLNLQELD